MSRFLGCLEYVLEEGPRKNWFGDDVIVLCTWVSAICGFPVPRACVHRQRADRRFARAGDPQLRHRQPAVVHHGHRDLLHGVSDAGVSRPCARLRFAADWRRVAVGRVFSADRTGGVFAARAV
jgi:hypothetical protein